MVFGISIGSSTVCSAVCVSGRCQVIANAGGDHRPRAVVGKTEHDLCVGAAALSARNTPLFRDVLTNFENNGPTHMMQQQGANVRVDVLLGALITEAVETCRNAKSDGTEVVLSVPDDWDQQKQNDFTKIFEAVSKMEVLRTIKRSAATWVGFNHNSNVEESEENKNKEPKNVLVIHVGGKSATGTLLREENGMISVVKSHRAGPGCDAIVTALVNQLVSEVNRKFRCDVSESRKALLKIESEARRAIEVLSNKETCPIQIESCFEGMDFQTTANRGRLQVTAPYKNILADIFQKFNEKPDEVILSGGGAKSPKIQSLVKSAYSESEVKICSNCDELVAKGCAIQCHIISDRTKLSIDEIPSRIPLSPISIIGKTEDDEINLISKGAPMPASFTISKNCEIMSPELEDGKNLVSVSGHTTENDGKSDGPKMQITVPKFSTSQGGWTEFHIFIDNVFHSAVRYRKLSRLYNDCVRGRRLLRRMGSNVTETIPRFPPKGLFKLSEKQLEERRKNLQCWLQALAKLSPNHSAHQQLQNFLCVEKERVSRQVLNESHKVSIYFLDGSRLALIMTTSRGDTNLVELVCRELRLPEQLFGCFSLYLLVSEGSVRKEEIKWRIERKLYPFESSAVVVKKSSGRRICLLRNYWNPAIDQLLLQSSQGLNLLFAETSAMYDRGWIIGASKKDAQLLSHYRSENAQNFIALARGQPYYSTFQFGPLYCSYPTKKTLCILNIGDYRIRFRIRFEKEISEVILPVRQVQSWEIKTSSSLKKFVLHLKPGILVGNSIEFITSEACLISSLLESQVATLSQKGF